jgi:hypothetical protein
MASFDPTEARYEVASGPKTVESPFMLTNLFRCRTTLTLSPVTSLVSVIQTVNPSLNRS